MKSSKPRLTYCLFADGSADPRSRKSGWGFVLQGYNSEIEGCGQICGVKSNRSELLAVINGLQQLPDESCVVIVFTDSLYVINKRAKAHCGEFWDQFYELSEKHEIHFVKVGSKNQHPTHKRAHHLAREATFNGRQLERNITC